MNEKNGPLTEKHFRVQLLDRHWRPKAGWQHEDQFFEGDLRLIALIWTLLATGNLILLEEPELSLHRRIVEQIPKLIIDARKTLKSAGGQILITTHSPGLLSDTSFSGTYLLLNPGGQGETTTIDVPTDEDLVAMKSGMSAKALDAFARVS